MSVRHRSLGRRATACIALAAPFPSPYCQASLQAVPPPLILGLSAFYHDSAACLVRGGQILAAAQEERFSRVKGDARFPAGAVNACLAEAACQPEDLGAVVFYEKPLLRFDRVLETFLARAPRGLTAFTHGSGLWGGERQRIPRLIRDALVGFHGPLLYAEHHESHAASAFFPSPFAEAAILTIDGVGEWATATIGEGRDSDVRIEAELRFPHSLGLLYSAFTGFCGFKVNSGEYKLMGLAPYGEPRYVELIRDRLVDLKADGSLRLDMSWFEFGAGLRMTGPRFADLFGGPARQPEAPLTQ